MLYLYNRSRGYFPCWATFPLAFDTLIMRYIWLNKCKCLQNSEQEQMRSYSSDNTWVVLDLLGPDSALLDFITDFEGKPDKIVHELGLLSTWTSFVKLLDRVLRDHVTWDSLWLQIAGNSGGPFNLAQDYAA